MRTLMFCLLLGIWNHFARAGIEETNLFVGGQEGYRSFRIPSAIVTAKGTVLAFCEGRKNGASDTGDIDLVLKRSIDGGKTWGALQVVWDGGANTCGNPCPVLDRQSGTVWLLMTHNFGTDKESQILAGTSQGSRTVWASRNEDDGASWSKPQEITMDVKKTNWTWYATGPGVGIQLKNGWLVVPCDNALVRTKEFYSHTVISTNHGASWQVGGVVGPQCNECQAVELADGAVLLNMRSYRGKNQRLVAVSKDGGMSFGEMRDDAGLIEPVCQASILRYDANRILFSNPASKKREKMTVRMSSDECRTWPVSKELYAGPSAYSCLTVLPDKSIGCFYERGTKNAYETITFARFTLEWLTEP